MADDSGKGCCLLFFFVLGPLLVLLGIGEGEGAFIVLGATLLAVAITIVVRDRNKKLQDSRAWLNMVLERADYYRTILSRDAMVGD